MSSLPHPPYDSDLEKGLGQLPAEFTTTLTPEALAFMKQTPQVVHIPSIEELANGRPLETFEFTVPGYQGYEMAVTVIKRKDHKGDMAPGIYHIHGGGMVFGDRFTGLELIIPWIDEYDAVAATVEYRLAPQNPDPVPVEDCYGGLVWFAAQAENLGFDPKRILIVGASAGGGLAAGTALMSRDRGGPNLAWQVLVCPMLDDRDSTISTRQFDFPAIYNRTSNRTGWGALLGHRRGGPDVSIYAAPARATDLSNLAPAFIDVGSAEVFRDEAVAYASGIWAAGGSADLHVWAGGFHGFGIIANAHISRESFTTRQGWIGRALGEKPVDQ